MLHRKQWELDAYVYNSTVDLTGAASTQSDGLYLWMSSAAASASIYDPKQQGYVGTAQNTLPTWSLGNCAIAYHPNGPTGTASAGTSNTITTTSTIVQGLVGYTIRITAGTGAGQERTILRNTFGGNSVITVSAAWSTTPDNTSTYLILSGRWWCINVSTSQGFRYYDLASNSWSGALSVSGMGLTTSPGMISTPAFGNAVSSGTATSATSTTLTDSTKSWSASQFVNSQVRIVSGTGAGQVRTITASSATAVTVAAWSTTPDTTSTYVVEPNDDYIYLGGGSSVTLYRYSISANTWTTLSPVVARTTALSAPSHLSFIGITSDTGPGSWADETNIKNCRYIYSFAGNGGSNVIAAYDIAANSWNNIGSNYGRYATNNPIIGLGYTFTADREYIYVMSNPSSTVNTTYRFNCVTNIFEPHSASLALNSGFTPSGTGRTFVASYTDGATVIRWLYYLSYSTPSAMYRMLLI